MQFAEETISSVLPEAKPLLKKHWREVEVSKFPLDPDYDLYLDLEKKGITKSFSSRVNGKMVGYAVYFVQYSHHYKTILMAKQDLIYLNPEERSQAHRFLQFCEKQLKEAGVKVIVSNAKINTGFEFLLGRLGYVPEETLYVKNI